MSADLGPADVPTFLIGVHLDLLCWLHWPRKAPVHMDPQADHIHDGIHSSEAWLKLHADWVEAPAEAHQSPQCDIIRQLQK